jgi:hypothetical protein
MEVSAFMTEQLKAQLLQQREHDMEQHREVLCLLKEQHEQNHQMQARMQAKVEEQMKESLTHQREVESLRQQHAQKVSEMHAVATQAKLRNQQLVVLQTRLERMHASKQLTEAELYSIEDIIVDSGDGEEGAAAELIALAERVPGDGSFARQLRRKVL